MGLSPGRANSTLTTQIFHNIGILNIFIYDFVKSTTKMDKTIVKYTHRNVFPIVILEVHNVFYNIGRN